MILSEKPIYSNEELETEEWKLIHIVDKPQKYYKRGTKLYVSTLGRCKVDDLIIELNPKKNGYLYFMNIPLHRIVYKTFVDDNINGLDIDHLDRNRQNNKISNLRACTRSENMRNPKTHKYIKESRNKQEYKQFQRNNNIGRHWINNGSERKKLFSIDCEKYIQIGWTYGYKF